MKCANCGAEFIGNFCPHCGTSSNKNKFLSESKECNNCGMKFSGNFCPNCGTPSNKNNFLSESKECNNCGMKFSGNFCPNCGSIAKNYVFDENSSLNSIKQKDFINMSNKKTKGKGCLLSFCYFLIFLCIMSTCSLDSNSNTTDVEPTTAHQEQNYISKEVKTETLKEEVSKIPEQTPVTPSSEASKKTTEEVQTEIPKKEIPEKNEQNPSLENKTEHTPTVPSSEASKKPTEEVKTETQKEVAEKGQYAVNTKNGKIHIVGACFATGDGNNAMTNPKYFDTYEAAEEYSATIEANADKRKCGNCW